jgi:hypothetical protein
VLVPQIVSIVQMFQSRTATIAEPSGEKPGFVNAPACSRTGSCSPRRFTTMSWPSSSQPTPGEKWTSTPLRNANSAPPALWLAAPLSTSTGWPRT